MYQHRVSGIASGTILKFLSVSVRFVYLGALGIPTSLTMFWIVFIKGGTNSTKSQERTAFKDFRRALLIHLHF
jgi:hypothetical protein